MSVALSILAGVLLLFTWSQRHARQQHARFTQREVAMALEEALDNFARHDGWDEFLAWPINDPCLESVRLRALQIAQASAEESGRDLSVAATEQFRALLGELRANA